MILLHLDGRKKYNRCQLCGEVVPKGRRYCKEHDIRGVQESCRACFRQAIKDEKVLLADTQQFIRIQRAMYGVYLGIGALRPLLPLEERKSLDKKREKMLLTINSFASNKQR